MGVVKKLLWTLILRSCYSCLRWIIIVWSLQSVAVPGKSLKSPSKKGVVFDLILNWLSYNIVYVKKLFMYPELHVLCNCCCLLLRIIVVSCKKKLAFFICARCSWNAVWSKQNMKSQTVDIIIKSPQNFIIKLKMQ